MYIFIKVIKDKKDKKNDFSVSYSDLPINDDEQSDNEQSVMSVMTSVSQSEPNVFDTGYNMLWLITNNLYKQIEKEIKNFIPLARLNPFTWVHPLSDQQFGERFDQTRMAIEGITVPSEDFSPPVRYYGLLSLLWHLIYNGVPLLSLAIADVGITALQGVVGTFRRHPILGFFLLPVLIPSAIAGVALGVAGSLAYAASKVAQIPLYLVDWLLQRAVFPGLGYLGAALLTVTLIVPVVHGLVKAWHWINKPSRPPEYTFSIGNNSNRVMDETFENNPPRDITSAPNLEDLEADSNGLLENPEARDSNGHLKISNPSGFKHVKLEETDFGTPAAQEKIQQKMETYTPQFR